MEQIIIEYKIGYQSGVKTVDMQDNWVEQCYKFDSLFTSWKVI